MARTLSSSRRPISGHQRARWRDPRAEALPGAYALRAVRAGRSVRNLWRAYVLLKWSPHLTRQNERCHENASDCLRLDRCSGDAGDTSTCRLLRGLPSRRTMPGVLRSVPAILWSVPAILWSIALLCSAPVILWSTAAILWSARLRLTGTPPRRPSEKARAVIERRRGVWRAPRGLPATPWQRPASHAWQRWQRLYVKALPRRARRRRSADKSLRHAA